MTRSVRTSHRLRSFADHNRERSPLYSLIARNAADDTDIVAILSSAPDDDGQAMLLLASAHYLLAQSQDPLRRYYATLGGTRAPDELTWSGFRRFVLSHETAIRGLLTTRFVQTNDVQRSGLIYPALGIASTQSDRPVAVLEIGCSAGLLMGLERFWYSYRHAGGDVQMGRPGSPIHLHCELGGNLLMMPVVDVEVAYRVGVDRQPVDTADPDQLAWLAACVWADRPARQRQLHAAVAEQRTAQPTLVLGDAINDLESAVRRIPSQLQVVVVTSWTMLYLSPERQQAFVVELIRISRDRKLWWIANETFESCLRFLVPARNELAYTRTGLASLSLMTLSNGHAMVTIYGAADPSGYRLEFFGFQNVQQV